SHRPDLNAHYGWSASIIITPLQAWAQGDGTWGESGMKILWSAANAKIYGGNVAEDEFLNAVSNMIGTRDKETRSISTGRGHRNISTQISRERILEVSDLASLPRERAVFIGAGVRPAFAKTIPW